MLRKLDLLIKKEKADGTLEPGTFWGSLVRPKTLGGMGLIYV